MSRPPQVRPKDLVKLFSIDIVDEHGKIIGQEELEQAHVKGLLHRSVHTLILDPKDRYYLRQRQGNHLRYPGYWTTTVGVHVLAGQLPKEVAKDSLVKNLGLDLNLEYVGEVRVHDEYENEISGVFIGKVDENTAVKSKAGDIIKAFSEDQIRRMNKTEKLTPYILKSVELYLNSSFK